MTQRILPVLSLTVALFVSATLWSQIPDPANTLAVHQVVPVTRPLITPPNIPAARFEVTDVRAVVKIRDRIATTQLDVAVKNPGTRQIEAEMVMPVPDGSVLRGFTFQGAAPEITARILPRGEARRLYESIVAQTRDPALLEFIGTSLIKSSVFPVPANGTQKVRLTYEQLLPKDGNRIDYVLPRSEGLDFRIPWTVEIDIKSRTPVASVFSPSHVLESSRQSPGKLKATIRSTNDPGPLQLSLLLQSEEGLSASLVAYPDPKTGGGYFMLLAAPPAFAPNRVPQKREVTLVIDKSGSMAGEKLEQVRAAALQVLAGLKDGEAFNILAYNEVVETFAPAPVVKSKETMERAGKFLAGIRVSGGTNIHDALVEALRQKPKHDMLPLVLFLTDGIPTIGQTSEKAIREATAKGNPHQRRIFTFGVGVDVNTPLLSRLARDSRAVASYVLPKEKIEVKVAGVFRRLTAPALAAPVLTTVDSNGAVIGDRTTELLPSSLPDIFAGDQLVLLGQYKGDAPLRFRLDGKQAGRNRRFEFTFQLDKATTANSYVPRLWASNKIGVLTEAIRDLGADRGTLSPNPDTMDPRTKELIDEVVRISREFGVLSEYTAFFAAEGTDLAAGEAVRQQAFMNYRDRAWNVRSGSAAANQELNLKTQIESKKLAYRNTFQDANLRHVEIANVQQINDKAFYKRGNRWIDSASISHAKSGQVSPDREVVIGTPEFSQLVTRLAEGNRQGCIALNGEILLRVDNENILVTAQ